MTWTTEKPTKPGWYWRRSALVEPLIVQIVRAEMDSGFYDIKAGDLVEIGNDGSKYLLDGGEWAGPIPEPGISATGMNELLVELKNYIEGVEEQISGEWGEGETAGELIQSGNMPEVYSKVVKAISDAG